MCFISPEFLFILDIFQLFYISLIILCFKRSFNYNFNYDYRFHCVYLLEIVLMSFINVCLIQLTFLFLFVKFYLDFRNFLIAYLPISDVFYQSVSIFYVILFNKAYLKCNLLFYINLFCGVQDFLKIRQQSQIHILKLTLFNHL